jgi:uncharacterized protein YndB with AHSA1/START domain
MSPPVIHKSFTIERSYPAAPARVFRAHSDPASKRRWFAEGKGFIIDSYTLDFQVGGFERSRFRFGADGPPMTYDGVYLDIVANERRFTEHTAFVDGNDGGAARREGSLGLLEALARELQAHA